MEPVPRKAFGPDGIRGLYAVTPDESDTVPLLASMRAALAGGADAITVISSLFAAVDAEATARLFARTFAPER